jgi:leucyl aminopeptidase (aminopeptidase T)
LKQLLPLREAPFAIFFHPDEDQIEGSISSMPSTSIEGTLISMMILNVFN